MKKSRAEQDLFSLLREEYPLAAIICQQAIKCGRQTLFLDYFIPSLSIAFEADGRQHFEFVPFFHRAVESFERNKQNDSLKDEWCRDNGITMIRFSFNEDVDQPTLRNKIAEKVGKKKTTSRRNRTDK